MWNRWEAERSNPMRHNDFAHSNSLLPDLSKEMTKFLNGFLCDNDFARSQYTGPPIQVERFNLAVR